MFKMPPHKLFPLILAALVAGCSDGSDGKDGIATVDVSRLTDSELAELDLVSEITKVTISSPPKVTFTLETSGGVPVVGLVPFWDQTSRFVRFTIAKLDPGEEGDPDRWVPYVRDGASGEPDYDTGSTLVDNGDGSYTFTFETDVRAVAGIPYEASLTHRVAGQIGDGSVPLESQNLVFDFVPSGGMVMHTRAITRMETCNECHDNLVFHGRRFEVEYCTNCHTKDLADGEGDFPYMIHRIHAARDFAVLDDAISYAEVTYPQALENCRKCHDGTDPATPQGDNWKNHPHRDACFSCHDQADHPGGPPPAANMFCAECHEPDAIEAKHFTTNPTPNNPGLPPGQYEVAYELLQASVDSMTDEVTVDLRILIDGTPLDVANLPADLAGPGRYPGLILAWALPQGGIDEPLDYNNLGRRAAQPLTIGLNNFVTGAAGTHAFDAGTGINTFVVTDPASQFPAGATLRAVGLEGYFQQDVGGEIFSLHTPSAVVAVDGDTARRMVVDSAKCASCHEWFEGHGGNRTYNIQICTLCHVPNLTSTGRTVTDPTGRDLDQALADAIADGSLSPTVDPNDPLTYPEDAQGLKDLIHGIHSSGFRTRAFQHVRGPTRQDYYDWSEVTFPRGASTSNCSLCHDGDSYALPVMQDVLPTTVRTTSVVDGQDASNMDVEGAFANQPNDTDWVNSPNAAACFGCHTSEAAMAHMEVNGGQLSMPNGMVWSNRLLLGTRAESCSVCHGAGKQADVELVHGF